MPLSPGTTLGPYEIVAPIGHGGMGEVYRAHDTTLNRDVALKVLPDGFTDDHERLARFQREAEVLASLNHPNIAQIYGLEQSDGVKALVLELVEGPTLAELIEGRSKAKSREPARGLPIDDVLPIARQIAEGLEAAHAHGVIHRDLKPANIKVTSDGVVKILDFGLAKALEPDRTDEDIANSPTVTAAAATRAGVIMGTAAYMSPEQAKGQPVDKRTDIWTFGCVLYEMLTGRRAFVGETVAEQLAAVLRGTPDWDAIPDATPFLVTRLIRRCLERDRRERVPDSAMARIEIADALTTPVGTPSNGSSAILARRAMVTWSVAGLLGACAIAVGMLWPRETEAIRPITRFDIHPLETSRNVVLSPDGMRLLYRAPTPDGLQLVIRRLDEFDARPIPGVGGGFPVSFSPDSTWVAYQADGEFRKVPVNGGTPITISEASAAGVGYSWGADDYLYFGRVGSGLWRVSIEGGEPEAITTPNEERGELDHHTPWLLPGGAAIVFTLHDLDRHFRIETLSLRSHERTVLIEDAFDARYVPTGHLVYGRGNAVFAAPFDAEALEITGPSVRLVENVYNIAMSGLGAFSVSADGTLAYVPEPPRDRRTLVWVSRDGAIEPLPIEPAAFGDSPRVSPDGGRIAVAVSEDDRSDIWIYDLRDQTQQRVTFEGRNRRPIWIPDGARVAFGSDRAGKENIYWTSPVAGGAAEPLLASGFWATPDSWAPDGDTLLFTEEDATDYGHIGLLRVSEPGSAEVLIGSTETQAGFGTKQSRFSPDGHFLAYMSDVDGSLAVHVRPFPDVNAAQWQISAQGNGRNPVWGPAGRELFYRRGRSMVAVRVMTTPTFDLGPPEVLFADAPEHMLPYDVSPDGRFLMVSRSAEELAPQPIRIVRNWLEELKARVPTQ